MDTIEVQVTDVVLRDGLQDEDVVVSTEDKCVIAEVLTAAGVRELEVASFVSAARVQQMADVEELLGVLPRQPGVRLSGIALNARGAERAARAGLDEIRLVVSAGAGYSRASAGRSTEQVLEEFAAVVSGLGGLPFSAVVSTAFVCPYDGPVAPPRLVAVVRGLWEMGVCRFTFADTLGTATTAYVLRSLAAVRDALPELRIGLHLHDVGGQALATVDGALSMGITRFDSALGGLGGCPFAPGGYGNLATGALAAHLHRKDVVMGVSEPVLADAECRLDAALRHGVPVGG